MASLSAVRANIEKVDSTGGEADRADFDQKVVRSLVPSAPLCLRLNDILNKMEIRSLFLKFFATVKASAFRIRVDNDS